MPLAEFLPSLEKGVEEDEVAVSWDTGVTAWPQFVTYGPPCCLEILQTGPVCCLLTLKSSDDLISEKVYLLAFLGNYNEPLS